MILFKNFIIDFLFHFLILLFITFYFKSIIQLPNNKITLIVFVLAFLITYINHIYFNKLRISSLIELIKRNKNGRNKL